MFFYPALIYVTKNRAIWIGDGVHDKDIAFELACNLFNSNSLKVRDFPKIKPGEYLEWSTNNHDLRTYGENILLNKWCLLPGVSLAQFHPFIYGPFYYGPKLDDLIKQNKQTQNLDTTP